MPGKMAKEYGGFEKFKKKAAKKKAVKKKAVKKKAKKKGR